MFPQKLYEQLARNECGRGLAIRFGGNPMPFPAHAFTQPEYGSRTDDLQDLLLILPVGQQDTNLAAFHQIDTRRDGTLLK